MSALETSVTLEEVFGVVNAKRVPLAPELAGYLALEIAEGADGAGGDVDPRFVFIGEEGTVGLVRPKREGAVGSAEGSVRTILARLLEASGSQTPALGTASKRRAGSGLPSLVEELEAALIPVNRAAGRRALARLAREVKRVTLGVGRNASMPPEAPPRRSSAPSYSAVPQPQEPRPAPVPEPEPPPPIERPAPRSVRPPTPPAAFPHEEERTTTRGAIPDEVRDNDRPFSDPDSAAPTARAPIHDASELPTVELTPGPVGKARDSVDSLIASFGVSSKTDQQVSRELKAMVGIDATAPPPRVGGRDSQVDALMAMTEDSAPAPRASAASIPDRAETPAPPPSSTKPARKKAASNEPRAREGSRDPLPPVRGPQISYSDDRQLPTGPSQIRVRASSDDLRPKRSGMLLLVALVALGLGALVIWRLKPGVFSGRTQERIDAEKQQAEADRQKQQQAAAAGACRATLVVTDVPPHAEVLKLVGQAPADVTRMPVGTRLEFVATAEGYAPKRSVLATGAAWDTGPDGKARIELPVQLEKSKAKPGQIDLWPAGEPGSEAGGNGPPGTVHVVSSPKGAEIWLLAGFGPDATIAQLPCDVDVDLLVAGPTTFRKRLHVASAEFKDSGDVKGGRAARVSAK